ncbi:MAG: hypothetical protein ACO29P_05755 [Bacteroidia bacterium]|jgi:type II secretory pathway component PulM
MKKTQFDREKVLAQKRVFWRSKRTMEREFLISGTINATLVLAYWKGVVPKDSMQKFFKKNLRRETHKQHRAKMMKKHIDHDVCFARIESL